MNAMELWPEGLGEEGTPLPKAPEKWEPKNLQWWHEQLVLFMVANPQATKKEIAAYFNCTEVYVGLITRTDAFRAYYEKHIGELRTRVMETMTDKLTRIGEKALDIIDEKLEEPEKVSLSQATDAAKFALTGLGYFQPKGPAVVVNNTNQTVVVTQAPSKVLEEARAKLRNQYDQSTASE